MKILVVHTSALHIGYLGAYGSDWLATPNLDQLAAEGVVFDQHFADWPTLEGVSESCFSGRYRLPGLDGSMPPAALPILQPILQSHGIDFLMATAGPTDAIGNRLRRWVHSDRGLCWVNSPPLTPPWSVPDDFLSLYFDPNEDEPLTPWLDPPTGPFDEEGPDLDRLQNTYAARVSCFDAELGKILDRLRGAGVLDDLMILVTASSGLPLGEHGYVGLHRAWLHEELVHVPLVVRLPGAAEAGLRIPALTQPVDLLPTFLAALELPPQETQGFDLLPLMRGEAKQVRSLAVSGLAVGDSVERAARTGDWAFLLPQSTPPDDRPRNPQLYIKPDDRWEVNDVRQQNIAVADELEQAVRDFGC